MQSMCRKELKALELNKYTTIKELVEYGLDRISDEEMITMNLTDFLYLRRVLEEYMFEHPLYPEYYRKNN